MSVPTDRSAGSLFVALFVLGLGTTGLALGGCQETAPSRSTTAAAEAPSEPRPLAPPGPRALPSPADDPSVKALLAAVAKQPPDKVAVLLAPHAKDVPPQGPAAGDKALLAESVHTSDPERWLTIVHPCRAGQGCKDVKREALDLAPLCAEGTTWLNDPGRQMARFESCVVGRSIVVRPDGPSGALAIVREQALPVVARELVKHVSARRGVLDRAELRRAFERATADRRLVDQLLSSPSRTMNGRDRRGDAFTLELQLAKSAGDAPDVLCGYNLVVEPGYKMSRQAWPRRYLMDALVALADHHLPKGSWSMRPTRDLKLEVRVRNPCSPRPIR